jgi:uncharacterized membrane protein
MDLELGPLHPIVVHFVIGFLVAGVLFRLAFLAGAFLLKGRLAFAGPPACALLLLGAAAAYVAVESGESASADAEAIPGAEAAVEAHEEWAHWTFRVFVVVAIVEAVGLALRRWDKALPALAASGALGLLGLYVLYETGEHGGTVVYSHAGGVGTRTGDPKDVSRLLLAGLYQHSVLDRSRGRPEEAARLLELAAARFPADLEIQLLLAQSQLEDRKDPAAATATLSRLQIPREERRLRLRHGILLVDALQATGQRDAATAALRNVKSEFPESGEVKERLRRLEKAPEPSPPSPSAAPSESPDAPSPSPSVPGS